MQFRFFDDHDELYWNVTGDEWDVPIQSAEAHIELPAGVAGRSDWRARHRGIVGDYCATNSNSEETAIRGRSLADSAIPDDAIKIVSRRIPSKLRSAGSHYS